MVSAFIGQLTPFEAVATALAFFGLGLGIGWRNHRIVSMKPLTQWVCATTFLRYAISFLAFHEPLREGYVVIVWALVGLVGIQISRPRVRP